MFTTNPFAALSQSIPPAAIQTYVVVMIVLVAAGFADAAPMARALIDAAADRIIWGSDYPHLSFADKVGSVELFNLLARWAPDEAVRHKILVDNPQQLFGF